MSQAGRISLYGMVACLSSALDLVSPAVANHQKRTAFIAARVAEVMKLSAAQRRAIILAAMLHDCGAMSLGSKLEALDFDFDQKNPHQHAELGYLFLKKIDAMFQRNQALGMANLVRHHHVAWADGRGRLHNDRIVAMESHLLHLADRVEVLCKRGRQPLEQAEGVRRRIDQAAGESFDPRMVQAFQEAASREAFWLELEYLDEIEAYLANQVGAAGEMPLDMAGLMGLSNIIGEMVDYRSSFTATHSLGVARAAELLAELAGFSQEQRAMIMAAGHLHDIGKLAVPSEILDKPALLDAAEMRVVKTHPYQTHRLLSSLSGLGEIRAWAAYHHETLDGAGYPFRLNAAAIPLGSRIIAVADIFTALTEDRPYRRGLPLAEVLTILGQLAATGKQDKLVIGLAQQHSRRLDEARRQAQTEGAEGYQRFVAAA